jgi:hypothetical protein
MAVVVVAAGRWRRKGGRRGGGGGGGGRRGRRGRAGAAGEGGGGAAPRQLAACSVHSQRHCRKGAASAAQRPLGEVGWVGGGGWRMAQAEDRCARCKQQSGRAAGCSSKASLAIGNWQLQLASPGCGMRMRCGCGTGAPRRPLPARSPPPGPTKQQAARTTSHGARGSHSAHRRTGHRPHATCHMPHAMPQHTYTIHNA